MRSLSALWLSTLAVFASAAHSEVDADGFERVPLIRHPDIDVTLLFRPRATPADEEFIGFLIDNKTGRFPQLGSSANYRIDNAQLRDRVTRQLVAATSLASGNEYDLLYREVMDVNTQRPTTPKGEIRRTQALSNAVLGALALPPKGGHGFLIQARVHMSLAFDGQFPSTPSEGVPIEFEWLPSNNYDRMQERLRHVLNNGDPKAINYGVLSSYLEQPEVGAKVATPDLIAGLRSWEQSGRVILKYLDEHRPPEEGLLDYALTIIEKRDYLRMSVLCESTSLHDVKLIEPLKAWATDASKPPGAESALVLLSKQIDLAPDRERLTAELGKTWLARSPITRSQTLDPKKPWRWLEELEYLALTRDRNLVPRLVPYLDRKEIVVDAKMISAMNNGVSTRACDSAYNTILSLLGRDREGAGIKFGWGDLQRKDAKVEFARRDKLIESLKHELSQ